MGGQKHEMKTCGRLSRYPWVCLEMCEEWLSEADAHFSRVRGIQLFQEREPRCCGYRGQSL